MILRRLLTLAALAGLLGACGDDSVGTIRIPLRTPQSTGVPDKVIIAAVVNSTKTCVDPSGSNTCSEILTADEATKSPGFVKKVTITPSSGSSAMFEDLPEGSACFVAEALNSSGSPLGIGCAEVELKLDKHVIEIELTQ
jgi:hypothetical protein